MKRNEMVRDARQCERVLRAHGCPIRNGSGSHRVATLPNGAKLTYPDHGEWGSGLASKITRLLAAAGLLGIAACMILSYLGQAGALK